MSSPAVNASASASQEHSRRSSGAVMDEPFGAVDPLTRKRLQEDSLTYSNVAQTVLFSPTTSTKQCLATRMAVLRTGESSNSTRRLQRLLGHPASKFARDFIGADRSLERLEVTVVKLEDLIEVPVVGRHDVAKHRQCGDDTSRCHLRRGHATTLAARSLVQ